MLCAIWIPEVSLGNTTFMEPVMDVEKVPRQRWKLVSVLFNSLDLKILIFPDLLHMPTEDGCVCAMQ